MANYNSLIRLSEIQRRTGYSKAWIHHLISQGRFPEQVKIGNRAIVLVEPEIDEWVEKCILEPRGEVA